MHRHHRASFDKTGRVLKWSLAITVLFVVVQVIAGLKAHSLALLSDAGHNFTDALALLLALAGHYLARKPADETRTFGYHRAGVLSAFLNALFLVGLAGVIFYHSYKRLMSPEPVAEMIMLVTAGLGLVVNLVIMWGLREDRQHDLNIRSAWAHMLGDALGSVGIIIGAILIRYTGWYRIDPILSIIIGGLIVWTAWDIIKESSNVLLEGLPKELDLSEVRKAIRDVPGVHDVHDLHIWSLGTHVHALSCHVLIDDMPPSESRRILDQINEVLDKRFHIHHTTIQFEHARCEISENGCRIVVVDRD